MERKFYAVEQENNDLDWIVITEPDANYYWVYNWDDSTFHRNRPLWRLHHTTTDPYPKFKEIQPQDIQTLIDNNYQPFTRNNFTDLDFWDAQTRTLTELTT